MSTRLVRWTHNGFHGYTDLAVRVQSDALPGDVVRLTPNVAYRLEQAVCSDPQCYCGETVTMTDFADERHRPLLFRVPTDNTIQRGNYPQT